VALGASPLEDPAGGLAAALLKDMKHTLAEVAEAAQARLVGEAGTELDGVASIEQATSDDLVFAENERHLAVALSSAAGAVVTGEFGAATKAGKPLLIATQPKLAFARAAQVLVSRRHHEPGVHSTAVVHHSVKLGKNVAIQPHAVLTEGVRVGERTRIGPNCAVGQNVTIGSHCNFAANVTVYPDTVIGDRVIVHAGAVLGSDGFGYVRDQQSGRYEAFPQIGVLIIEDDVEIGANTTIDRGALGQTIIRRGTKIDNLVHIAHNVDVGEDVVIAAQTGISGSAVIEKGAIIAGQVGIADHVRIGEGAILGAQCGVPTSKIIRGKGELFWGTPARPIKEYLKQLAVLARMARK
jgi:UDP-3-O-[3-hydroxymyristoyl] glucosamine N-acyltransferase